MAKEGPLFTDSDFSKERFYQTYNTDLANDFGNLVNRIFKLIKKYYDNKIPLPGRFTKDDKMMAETSILCEKKVMDLLEDLNVNAMATEIISYVTSINRYLEKTEPWKLAKTDLDTTATVLYTALASLRFSASLLYPLLPEKMTEFFSMLNNDDTVGTLMKWEELKSGVELGEMKALFPRFDMKLIETM
jgi:methionyl-tRNA synthetase